MRRQGLLGRHAWTAAAPVAASHFSPAAETAQAVGILSHVQLRAFPQADMYVDYVRVYASGSEK